MSLILTFVAASWAQDFGYVAIVQQAREAILAKDYKTAKTLLTAADAAAPTSSSPLAEADLAKLHFYRGLIEWRSGDKDKAALDHWRRVLVVAPQFEPDPELLPEVDAQDVLYALRGEVRNYEQFPTGLPEDSGDALIFIDGKRLSAEDMLLKGRHLVQIRCGDGNFAGSWYEFGAPPTDYLVLCSGGTFTGKPVAGAKPDKAAEKKAAAEAKAAEKAKAEAEKKALADAKAAEKAKAEAEKKALADAKAAEKAAADKASADKASADKAAADKAAADKASADKASADKAAAEKAAADKAAADKAAADKAAADKAVVDAGAGDKAAADKAAADKAAADKAAADKAAADKAAADKAAADKAAADKAAADKAAADKAAADKLAVKPPKGSGSEATITRPGTLDVPAVLLMSAGGGLLVGGAAMNFGVVEPAYAAIVAGNEAPGSLSAEDAAAWEGRFDIGRYSTIAMVGTGVALLGAGVVLQVVDSPVMVVPGGIVVGGQF